MNVRHLGVVSTYTPITETELVSILLEYFDTVEGTTGDLGLDQNPPSERIGAVASLPYSDAYRSYSVLPEHNPNYGEQLRFLMPELLIAGENFDEYVVGEVTLDPELLYYCFVWE